jgi:hypothetical protein
LIFENKLMTENETQIFWEIMYEIYGFASELIIVIDKHKPSEETLYFLSKIKEKIELNKHKLVKNNDIFANLLEEEIVL